MSTPISKYPSIHKHVGSDNLNDPLTHYRQFVSLISHDKHHEIHSNIIVELYIYIKKVQEQLEILVW